MKNKLLYIVAALLLGFVQQAVAVSTPPVKDANKWYYIRVIGGDAARQGLVWTVDADGVTILGKESIVSPKVEELEAQLWRFENGSTASNYSIINRATGKKVVITYDAEKGINRFIISGDDTYSSSFTIATLSGNCSIQATAGTTTKPNDTYAHQANNYDSRGFKIMALSTTAGNVADCSFEFIPFEDLTPKPGTDTEYIWYNITSAQDPNTCIVDAGQQDYPNIQFSILTKNTSTATHQWRLVKKTAAAGDDRVEFINRETGNCIHTSVLYANKLYYTQKNSSTVTSNGWNLNFLGSGQFEIYGEDSNEGVSRYLCVADETTANPEYLQQQNSPFAWIFRQVATSVPGAEPAVSAEPLSVAFVTGLKVPQTRSLIVVGENLSRAISFLNLPESIFVVEKADGWNDLTGGTLNITFTPTEDKSYSANFVIVGQGAAQQPISLSGEVNLPVIVNDWYRIQFLKQKTQDKVIQSAGAGGNLTQDVLRNATLSQWWKFVPTTTTGGYKIVSKDGSEIDGNSDVNNVKTVAAGNGNVFSFARRTGYWELKNETTAVDRNVLSDKGNGAAVDQHQSHDDRRLIFIPISEADIHSELTVTPAELTFDPTQVGTTASAQVTVSGVDLTADIAYTGATATFAVTKAAGWSNTNGGTLNITFTPAAEGVATATLTISGGGAVNKTVALSGTGITFTRMDKVDATFKVYVQDNILYVETATAQRVKIYTATGLLVFDRTVEGKTPVALSSGVYVVKAATLTQKVVL